MTYPSATVNTSFYRIGPPKGDFCVARNLDEVRSDGIRSNELGRTADVRPLDLPPIPDLPSIRKPEIRFRCVRCGALLKVAIEWIGEAVVCPRCETRMVVLQTMDEALAVDPNAEPLDAIVVKTRKTKAARRSDVRKRPRSTIRG
jgi:DNA-directed RNA polymerase subunit RPC12/RpoP